MQIKRLIEKSENFHELFIKNKPLELDAINSSFFPSDGVIIIIV